MSHPGRRARDWSLTRDQLNNLTDSQWYEFLFNKGVILDIVLYRLDNPEPPQFTWTSRNVTVNGRAQHGQTQNQPDQVHENL